MSNGQYISVREAAQVLGVSEKKIMDFIDQKKLIGYRIANQFLRLKKTEVMSLRNSGSVENEQTQFFYTTGEKVKDFFYFNDFYLLSLIIILILLYFIFHAS